MAPMIDRVIVTDAGTRIAGVLVIYLEEGWSIYDPLTRISLCHVPGSPMKGTRTLEDMKAVLQQENPLINVDAWAMRGATMLAFIQWLDIIAWEKNTTALDISGKTVNVETIRFRMIRMPEQPKKNGLLVADLT